MRSCRGSNFNHNIRSNDFNILMDYYFFILSRNPDQQVLFGGG